MQVGLRSVIKHSVDNTMCRGVVALYVFYC